MEEKNHIEIINLLNELEKMIDKNINMYNYYIDVITDRFPNLSESKEFQKKEVIYERKEESNKRI